MSDLTITTSANIALLSSHIIADMCAGQFLVDISDSVFIGGGEINVLGVSVEIVNPSGVTVKAYPTSGYDISNDSPPLSSTVEFAIPTQAGNYQYGTYTVSVKLTDADGTEYVVTKTVKLCEPDALHKTRNYGSLSARINGICTTGKVFIIADTPPNYNGAVAQSVVNDFRLLYPTESQLYPIDTVLSSFSAQLYEGEYKITGTICATYNFGDNVYVSVNYRVKKSKEIKCIIDECCVFDKLAELHRGLTAKCTAAEIEALSNTTLDTLRLLKTAQLAAECGNDPSDYINDLEALLGCKCTCNCNVGTPIINNSPATDILIEGCGVESELVGLTKVYTIENYSYTVSVNPNGNVLTVASVTLNGCIQTTILNFNILPLYTQIKSLASTDYPSWATIVNKSWNGIDPACLGLSPSQWAVMSFTQRGQALADAACTGGVCVARISADNTEAIGSGVNISWSNNTPSPFEASLYEVAVYMDDILVGTVLGATTHFLVAGAADGNQHTYALVAKCSNGTLGNALDGDFTYIGCPAIAVPVVSASNVPDADCPYDLTALVSPMASGLDAEWHNLNSTSAGSLVPDDTNVMGGTYYVFAKNSDGCYSLGVKVVVVCSTDTDCTAPQNLLVEAITGGYRVRFQSAAFPPPTYTVKRRLASTADVDGSYTTIGTPTYNSGAARWEILDSTGVDNTLYVYKVISNCANATTPYALLSFANITCPAISTTPANNSVDYSFVPVGGEVDKYEVEVYNSTATVRQDINTHLPAFSNPVTGTAIYLSDCTVYLIRVKVYIGSYVKVCVFTSFTTICNNYYLGGGYNFSIDSVTGTGVPALGSTGTNGLLSGIHTGMSGNYNVDITGTVTSPPIKLLATVNGVQADAENITVTGTYVLAITALVGEVVLIRINLQ